MTSPAMVEAAMTAFSITDWRTHNEGAQTRFRKLMTAAIEAALPSALAAAEAKGFAAGVEAAADRTEGRVLEYHNDHVRAALADMAEIIRALRPPAAPAESKRCPECRLP